MHLALWYAFLVAVVACGHSGGLPSVASAGELTPEQEGEWRVLKRLYEATGGPNWTSRKNWDVDGDRPVRVCDLALNGSSSTETVHPGSSWKGIECKNGSVYAIYLGNNNLVGSASDLPTMELGLLPNVYRVDMFSNHISGSFPPVWNASKLQIIGLDYNSLEGSVPTRIVGVPRLRCLFLGNNHFTGELPLAYGEGFGELEVLELKFLSVRHELSNSSVTWSGLPRLLTLDLSFCTQLTGSFPRVWAGLSTLTSLDLTHSLVSGAFPRSVHGLRALKELKVSRTRMSGTLPPAGIEGLVKLRSLYAYRVGNAGSGRLHGTLEFGPTDSFYRKLAVLDLSYNELEGALPSSVGDSQLELLDLTGNKFTTGMAEFFDGASRGGGRILLESNRISAQLPPHVCNQLHIRELRLRDNSLFGTMPWCLGGLPDLVTLDLAQNNLTQVDIDRDSATAVAATTKLRVLELSHNSFASEVFGEAVKAGAHLRALEKISLSRNPLNVDVNKLFATLYKLAPGLRDVNATETGLIGTLGLPPRARNESRLSLTTFFAAHNPDLIGVNSGDSEIFANLERLDLSHTNEIVKPPPMNALVTVRRANVPLSDCSTAFKLVQSSHTSLIDIRGSRPLSAVRDGIGAVCRQNFLRDDLKVDPNTRRLFPSTTTDPRGGLFCPAWQTNASEAVVLADATFLRYERCSCFDGWRWEWEDERAGTGKCVLCDESLPLLCDPHVLDPRPCLFPGYFPVVFVTSAPGSARLPKSYRELQHNSIFLRCPGGAEWCAPAPVGAPRSVSSHCTYARMRRESGHTNEEEDRERVSSSFFFRCADGRDNRTFMCTGCSTGHWHFDDRCLDCADAYYSVTVPLVILVGVPVALYVMWTKAGTAAKPNARHLYPSFIFFIQATALLRASSDAAARGRGAAFGSSSAHASAGGTGAGSGDAGGGVGNETGSGSESSSTSTLLWPWLRMVVAHVDAVLAIRPAALACLDSGFDYSTLAAITLAVPYVIFAGGAAVHAVHSVRQRQALARRSIEVAWWLLFAAYLPVATTAFAVIIPCEELRAGALHTSYLSAAPYVSCSDPPRALVVARAMGWVTIFVYVLGMPALALYLLRRQKLRSDGGGARGGAGDDGADAGGRTAAASLASAAPGGELDVPLLEGSSPVADLDAAEASSRQPRKGSERVRLMLADSGAALARRQLCSLRSVSMLWWWPVVHDLGRGLALAVLAGVMAPTSPLRPLLLFAALIASAIATNVVGPRAHALDNAVETMVEAVAMAVYVAGTSQGGDLDSNKGTRVVVSLLYVLVAVAFVVCVAFSKRALGTAELASKNLRAHSVADARRPPGPPSSVQMT